MKECTDNQKIIGRWHDTRVYTGTSCYINVAGTITGCGLAQIHGIVSVTLDDLNKILKKIKKDYKEDGAGAIIATLGQSYYGQENTLIAAGFEFVKEYHNYRHGTKYMQKMYILTY